MEEDIAGHDGMNIQTRGQDIKSDVFETLLFYKVNHYIRMRRQKL